MFRFDKELLLNEVYWIFLLAAAFAALMSFTPRTSRGTELNFFDEYSDEKNYEKSSEILYKTEARIFLSKKRIPLSFEFNKYVSQNDLYVYSCYILYHNEKIMMITIKYIRALEYLSLCQEKDQNERSNNYVIMPVQPYVVANYGIDFRNAMSWWKIELDGKMHSGKEKHCVY